MDNNWCEKAWSEVRPIFHKTIEHSFIKELMDGSLPQEKFMFYIAQDSIYLGEYGRILAGIGSKFSKAEYRSSFLKFASDTVFVEQELHKGFQKLFEDNPSLQPTPTCLLYTSFLHTQATMESLEVAVAAVLPCFVVYKKVGDYILKHQSGENNPYQDWINTYGGEDFAKAVAEAERITNVLAQKTTPEIRQQMMEAYTKATQLEWMFWNSAYELEQWPV